MRTVTHQVTETMTDEQELKLLREMIAVQPFETMFDPLTPGYRRRGEVLKVVVNSGEGYEVGQILVVRRDGAPDDDGQYEIWYLDEAGALSWSYVSENSVVLWASEPRKMKAEPKHTGKRRLELGDD